MQVRRMTEKKQLKRHLCSQAVTSIRSLTPFKTYSSNTRGATVDHSLWMEPPNSSLVPAPAIQDSKVSR